MKSTHQRMIYTFIKRMARRLCAATLLERVLVVLTVAHRAPAGCRFAAVGLNAAVARHLRHRAGLGCHGRALIWLGSTCLQRRSLESVHSMLKPDIPHCTII